VPIVLRFTLKMGGNAKPGENNSGNPVVLPSRGCLRELLGLLVALVTNRKSSYTQWEGWLRSNKSTEVSKSAQATFVKFSM
jgi:hypothetical protein